MAARIVNGTRIRYSGPVWNTATERNEFVDGLFIALDGVDVTERGAYLVVVPPAHYPPKDESHDLLICDGYLEFIEVLPIDLDLFLDLTKKCPTCGERADACFKHGNQWKQL